MRPPFGRSPSALSARVSAESIADLLELPRMAKRSPWFHDPELVRSRARSLGVAIKERRTELGLSRPELARRASLSYPYVAELETGRKQGSPSALHALASALDLTTPELLARAEG